MRALAGILASLILLLALALLPLPIRPYLDFQVIYHADLGLLRGISLYDHVGQVNMIAQLAHVSPHQVFVLPFPYPPWYALSTLWLALVPINVAARLWFGLNLIMLIASVWLLIGGLTPTRRLPLYCLAILWVPVLGSLFVGQYTFPVLLGAALMDYSLRKSSVVTAAIAAALLTFKPHLGALLLLLVVIHLWLRRDGFGRKAVIAMLAAGVVLLALGYLASPGWPVAYAHSLTAFKSLLHCFSCSSLPLTLVSLVGGGVNDAMLVSAVVLAALCIWLARNWHQVAASSDQLVTGGLLMTLLASPYLENYDHLLMIVPFVVLSRQARGSDWAWLVAAFVVPLISLALLGPAGSAWLSLSALVLFVLLASKLEPSGPSSSTA